MGLEQERKIKRTAKLTTAGFFFLLVNCALRFRSSFLCLLTAAASLTCRRFAGRLLQKGEEVPPSKGREKAFERKASKLMEEQNEK